MICTRLSIFCLFLLFQYVHFFSFCMPHFWHAQMLDANTRIRFDRAVDAAIVWYAFCYTRTCLGLQGSASYLVRISCPETFCFLHFWHLSAECTLWLVNIGNDYGYLNAGSTKFSPFATRSRWMLKSVDSLKTERVCLLIRWRICFIMAMNDMICAWKYVCVMLSDGRDFGLVWNVTLWMCWCLSWKSTFFPCLLSRLTSVTKTGVMCNLHN